MESRSCERLEIVEPKYKTLQSNAIPVNLNVNQIRMKLGEETIEHFDRSFGISVLVLNSSTELLARVVRKRMRRGTCWWNLLG
jgi:hypothetical protein